MLPLAVSKDFRSMRKLDRSTMVLIMENAAVEGSTFNVRVNGLVRVLYKLP